ncbi:MAG: TetR-like C-terminal domain-containing protein, partial [Pseudomonadota bacterium]
NLYRLMQGPELGDLEAFPELRDAMAAPARTLVRLIEQLFVQHSISGRSANRASLALWALAHGIGTLALDGQLSCEAAPSLARDAAAAMIAGWLSDSN